MNEPTSPPPNLSAVLDLPLTLRLVVGSCRQSAQAVLRLGAGSVLTLDSEPGGQVSLFAGHKLVAHANIVMVEGQPAVQITAIENDVERN